jgi:hypothetical protein
VKGLRSVIAVAARLDREELHYPFHDLLPGSVTEPFKVRVRFNRYGTKAVRGRSKSQLHKSQAYCPGEAA